MNRVLSSIFIFFLVFTQFSCITQKMKVVCVCEEGVRAQDTLKWDIFPDMEGSVEIFASSTPDVFNLSMPLSTVNIADRVVLIPKLGEDRKYFMLSFDNQERVYVTNRKLNVPGVCNMRDIGGYAREDGQSIKWGQIYRSGSLAEITDIGRARLQMLHIKTILDLSSKEDIHAKSPEIEGAKTISIPINDPFANAIRKRLVEGKCKRNDAIILMQDAFYSFTVDYDAEITNLFDVLGHANNYPLLIVGGAGNHRVGYVISLIMSALNMPDEAILDDFLFSNSCIEMHNEVNFGQSLPPDEQEALTVLMTSQKSFLDYAFEKMRQENGSVDQYFTKKLSLNPKKREKLQQILLTR
jgi:protein-tyrosine phosphatase